MDLEVVPFESRFTEPAAALLAGGHRQAQGAGALDLADVEVARRLVDAVLDAGPAVAAVRDGRLVGYLAAALTGPPGDQRARIRIHQHAAAPTGRRQTYRALYAALSGHLVAAGRFEHTVLVAAGHRDVTDCLTELGFGIDQIKGIRPPQPPPATARAARVRPARPEDLAELTLESQKFHAQPPMLRPALIDLRAIHDGFRQALTEDRQLLLVAEEHGHLTGMTQAGPDARFRATATIGIAVVTASARSRGTGTALLAGMTDWAAAHGFETCGTEWTSANPVGDAFWRGHGFTPVRYTLTRLIDARVTWAHADLSYRGFLPDP
ncbi:GNAT family N-acetyltransferase [Streptomyces pinistramenti]|uniref:GNAT family N-acetyltransferase n=1 Tax=Streptomyces pinistramenti TaxID=2884812 RepID=UPI001D07C29B|nr:GNAT family N-acetyltransferase [Streptomyces pinistramenti]MCB5907395.1 GNAT family N-acetyltransferase [Streptomyces pinistramenti]